MKIKFKGKGGRKVTFDTSAAKDALHKDRVTATKKLGETMKKVLEDYIKLVSDNSTNRREALIKAGFEAPNSGSRDDPLKDATVEMKITEKGQKVTLTVHHSNPDGQNLFKLLDEGTTTRVQPTTVVFPIFERTPGSFDGMTEPGDLFKVHELEFAGFTRIKEGETIQGSEPRKIYESLRDYLIENFDKLKIRHLAQNELGHFTQRVKNDQIKIDILK